MGSKPYRTLSVAAVASVFLATAFLAGCTSESRIPAGAFASSSPAATSPKEKVDGGEITTAYLAEPQTFLRYWATTPSSLEAIDLVFSSLYKRNDRQELVPDLAVGEPVLSADQKEMTVRLRPDAQFSDGRPVTADDVVFTYGVPQQPGYTGPRREGFAELERVAKADEHTVTFVWKQPYAGYRELFGYSIWPQQLLKDIPVGELDKAEFAKRPVGSGPYKLEEWKPGQALVFKRNEAYYGGKPAIEKITAKIVPDAGTMLTQLQAGELNVLSVPSSQLEAVRAYAATLGTLKVQPGIRSSQYTFVGWNLANPLFQDPKVRQALTAAIDRQAIVSGAAGGQGVVQHSATPPGYAAIYTEDVPQVPYSLERAKALLAEAGWADTDRDGILDRNGKPFAFELQVNAGSPEREKGAALVQQQLRQAGIQATPKLVEPGALLQTLQSKQFEAVYSAWSLSGDPNPKALWHSSQIDRGLNAVSYRNAEVDRLIEEDLLTLDPAKRKPLLNRIDALIAQDQPYTFLYSPTSSMAYPSRLEGYDPQGVGLKGVERWYYTN